MSKLINESNMSCTQVQIKGESMAKKGEVGFMEVPMKMIKLGRNSRLTITDAEIAGLMGSIKETGLLQPIGLVASKKGGYEIAYGNRRFLAVGKLGYKTIAAIVHEETSESDVDMKNLTENVQRRNLSLSEAGRYIQLLRAEGLSHKEIAVRLGVSMSYINSCLEAFSDVPAEFRDHLVLQIGGGKVPPGKIAMKAAVAITSAAKTYNLTKPQAAKLFQAAKDQEGFRVESVQRYAAAFKQGKENPLESVSPVKAISCQVIVTEDHFEALYNKHVVNGPFKSLAQVLRAILSGELNQRIKILQNSNVDVPEPVKRRPGRPRKS